MRVLIADDHAVLREGVKSVLAAMPGIGEIDEAANGNTAMDKIKEHDYDMVILDISMPGSNGFDILRHIRDTGNPVRTLVISFHPEEQYAARAFRLGASGYISKCASFGQIRKAIARVARGGRYVSPEFAEKLAFANNSNSSLHENLSDREFQVMLMLARGESVSDIARKAFISDKTVSTYRSRILKKMGMKSNADLTRYAIHTGLIE